MSEVAKYVFKRFSKLALLVTQSHRSDVRVFSVILFGIFFESSELPVVRCKIGSITINRAIIPETLEIFLRLAFIKLTSNHKYSRWIFISLKFLLKNVQLLKSCWSNCLVLIAIHFVSYVRDLLWYTIQ